VPFESEIFAKAFSCFGKTQGGIANKTEVLVAQISELKALITQFLFKIGFKVFEPFINHTYFKK
jgi:hypothetical protein